MPGYLAPIIWLLAALLLPGAASFLWLDGASWVPGWLARLAVVIALGLTTWPVLLLWSSLIGLKYNTALEMAVLLLSAAAVLAWVWRARHFLRPASSPELPAGGSPVPRLSFPDAAHLPGLGLVLLLLLAAWTRWQPLALWTLPAWIDGVHHAWITQLINLDQRLPSDFGPLLPAAPFLYHFGFHALAALPAATGVASAAYSVLVAGQLLSLLVTLQVAAWAGHMLPSWPWAPVGAALVTGCLSLFPAYFVNWSRYPQLAGLVLLPALALLCAAFPIPARRRHHLLITFLAAGLALTHYRMALVAACVLFALAWSGGRFAGRVTGRISCRCGLQPHVRLQTAPTGSFAVEWSAGKVAGRRLFIWALGAAVLVLPWLVRLAQSWLSQGSFFAGVQLEPDYFTLPTETLVAAFPWYLTLPALAGVTLAIRRRQWTLLAVTATGLVLAGVSATLPITLLNLETLVISAFLFLSLPVALLVGEVLSRLPRLGLALVLLAGVWGTGNLAHAVVPQAQLATRWDQAAAVWLAGQPPGLVLINSRPWQSGLRVGTDGGYWLPVLSDHLTTTPPAVYAFQPPERVADFNRLAGLADPGQMDSEGWAAMLDRQGIRYVYVGAPSGGAPDGPMTYQRLMQTPGLHLAYTNGEAWIFTVTPMSLRTP